MIRQTSIVVAVALSLAACASATKRYEQGQDLQRQGRSAEAAERFIQALKKDSRQDSARVGLRTSGAAAIATYLSTATNPSTPPDAAAEAYLAVDDLQKRALDVGIYLVEPPDYAATRRAALDKALDNVVVDARQLAFRHEFGEAIRRLDRASTGYQPNSTQASALGNGRAEVLLTWARADTTDGHFRSAYERINEVGAIAGVSSQQTDDARAIQTLALGRGTRRVAIVPAWATVAARRALPDDALPALGDALLDNPWITPPRFVALMPPDQVDRDLRRLNLSRQTLSTIEATRLGRALGADFVIVTEVDSVRRDEFDVRIARHPTRTTRGADTAYFTEEGQTRLFARATFVVIDGAGQRSTNYQSVSASAAAPFSRVRFAGDYRTLDLRQAERALFERDRAPDRELVRSFVGAMSPRLAEAVYAEVLRRIP